MCAGELDERGNVVLTPFERTKIEKRPNADGTWRWYGVYAGGVRVRLDTTDEDRARRFNRSEHLRPIPPGDTDYDALSTVLRRRVDQPGARRLQLVRPRPLRRSGTSARQPHRLRLAVNSLARLRHRRRLALAARSADDPPVPGGSLAS
ncbi:MAG: hypothetical protein ACRDWD_17920 [Acidimicrobiia bacterium]